mmetsp:Transcript_21206/g.60618  ORF Transcript_21206/g.60618 Transcript_21206/m.60618 type:complete len:239 (-) Transcript_21206:94-810(-)
MGAGVRRTGDQQDGVPAQDQRLEQRASVERARVHRRQAAALRQRHHPAGFLGRGGLSRLAPTWRQFQVADRAARGPRGRHTGSRTARGAPPLPGLAPLRGDGGRGRNDRHVGAAGVGVGALRRVRRPRRRGHVAPQHGAAAAEPAAGHRPAEVARGIPTEEGGGAGGGRARRGLPATRLESRLRAAVWRVCAVRTDRPSCTPLLVGRRASRCLLEIRRRPSRGAEVWARPPKRQHRLH